MPVSRFDRFGGGRRGERSSPWRKNERQRDDSLHARATVVRQKRIVPLFLLPFPTARAAGDVDKGAFDDEIIEIVFVRYRYRALAAALAERANSMGE